VTVTRTVPGAPPRACTSIGEDGTTSATFQGRLVSLDGKRELVAPQVRS